MYILFRLNRTEEFFLPHLEKNQNIQLITIYVCILGCEDLLLKKFTANDGTTCIVCSAKTIHILYILFFNPRRKSGVSDGNLRVS